MRVTEYSRYDLLRSQLGRTNFDVAEVSGRLASGKAIDRWSDDPELAVQADRLLAEDRALEAYADAAVNAKAWLSTQDGALQTAVSILHRVRELAISAGIGLFLALIALENAGIVADHQATLVTMGELSAPGALLALAGFFVIVAFSAE